MNRPCLYCGKPRVSGQSRCLEHSGGWKKSPQMQARSKLYATRSWRARSKRQIEAFPYCAWCGDRATVADHIDNIGGTGAWDGPLQSLCRPCHAKKTAAEGAAARRR